MLQIALGLLFFLAFAMVLRGILLSNAYDWFFIFSIICLVRNITFSVLLSFRKPHCASSSGCFLILLSFLFQIHIILLLCSIGLYLYSCYTPSWRFIFNIRTSQSLGSAPSLHAVFRIPFIIVKPSLTICFNISDLTLSYSFRFSYFLSFPSLLLRIIWFYRIFLVVFLSLSYNSLFVRLVEFWNTLFTFV